MIFFYLKKYCCDVKIKINFIFLKSCVTELFINIFKANRVREQESIPRSPQQLNFSQMKKNIYSSPKKLI
jgi:hypothetical protein